MAVKKKNTQAADEVLADETLVRISGKILGLMRKHKKSLVELIEDSEDKQVSVPFMVKMDLSESEPNIDVGIRYTSSTTDHVMIPLGRSEDPNQIPLIPKTDDELPPDLTPEEQEKIDEEAGVTFKKAVAVEKARRGRKKKGSSE